MNTIQRNSIIDATMPIMTIRYKPLQYRYSLQIVCTLIKVIYQALAPNHKSVLRNMLEIATTNTNSSTAILIIIEGHETALTVISTSLLLENR
jgi:hypothetical protein